ncbi:glucose 1-dehydrogenase [Candidatus Woesearchaeota archaeon]|nr:glucose 1-dehydrogenase [Candidatus Woesearchaeota archaeon]
MQLKNKVAIVTGASSGIGKAIAILFAKQGAHVVIAARSADGKKVENEIRKMGGSAIFIKTDVTSNTSVKSMVAQALKTFKRIDILVNNAGIMLGGTAETTSEQTWDAVLDTNLKGTFLCSKHCLPHLKKTKNAAIINIASEWGLNGGQGYAAYCASKGGVVNLTRAMALDHAREGIRVNCIAPGPINTHMLTSAFKKDELKYIASLVPLGRIGTPEEVANVALFLASDLSSFVTGSIYSVDGGDMAGYYA